MELSVLGTDGFAVMSEKLVLVYKALLDRQVPGLWANRPIPPPSPWGTGSIT